MYVPLHHKKILNDTFLRTIIKNGSAMKQCIHNNFMLLLPVLPAVKDFSQMLNHFFS